MKTLSLELSSAARQSVADAMQNTEHGSLPALFFASAKREHDVSGTLVRADGPHWYLTAYTPAQVKQLSTQYASQGHELVYAVQDLALCITQSQLVADLIGRTLDAEGSRVWVR